MNRTTVQPDLDPDLTETLLNFDHNLIPTNLV